MRNYLTVLISLLVLSSMMVMIIPHEVDANSSPARQRVNLQMYGDAADGNLSSEKSTTDEDEQADCDDGANKRGQESSVGIWRSDPFTRGTIISGLVNFSVWAKTESGTVKGVQFTCQISVDGDQMESFTTNTLDADSTAREYSGDFTMNIPSGNEDDDRLHLNAGDSLQIEIIYDGNDDYWETSGHTVILYGSIDHASGIEFPLNGVLVEFDGEDIEVYDENEPDEEKNEAIFVEITLDYIFGLYDLNNIGLKMVFFEYKGTTFDYEIIEEEEGRYTVKWRWQYGVDQAPSGTYEVNITTTDNSGNVWYKTYLLHLVTTIQKKIDFVVSSTGLQVTNVFAKTVGQIDLTISCYGEDGLTGLTPQVIFTITTPEGGNPDIIYRMPAISTQQDVVVSVEYFFNNTGMYQIDAEVNPKTTQAYHENNDNDDAEDNNVVTMNIVVKDEPNQDEDKEWWEELRDDFEDDQNYQIGLVAMVAVIIVVVVLLVVRRKRSYDEYDDDDEEYDDQ